MKCRLARHKIPGLLGGLKQAARVGWCSQSSSKDRLANQARRKEGVAGREADGAKAERAIVVDEESCQSGNETSSLCSEAMGGGGKAARK